MENEIFIPHTDLVNKFLQCPNANIHSCGLFCEEHFREYCSLG